ncbi:MAG: YHS domain-containing protein [Acidobacteriaceae bacterium]
MSHYSSNETVGAVKDPVCGMTVNPEKAAAKAEFAGEDFYFCSQGCAAKFRENPERYLAADKPAAAHTLEADYTCPMHPEVRQKGPGSCPKCGMALEPETISAPAAKVEYTCPCTRRSCVPSRVTAQSAAWPWSRAKSRRKRTIPNSAT